MRQEPITLACMTQDRVHNLKILLPKVMPYVDRVIIIDGSPEGLTKDYCEELGPKVMWKHRKWDDNFVNQWNEYLKYVNGGWILVLDDDETPSTEMLEHLDYFVNASNYGNNFSLMKFRCHTISEGVKADTPANYWREIFFRWTSNLKYHSVSTTGCHQFIAGYQNHKVFQSDFVYYHSKSLRDEYKNAARNYFIYGIWKDEKNIFQTEEWHELKSILKEVHPEVDTFPDLDHIMEEGKLNTEIKNWIVRWYKKLEDHEDYNEMRAFCKYYFDYVKPEEAKTCGFAE